MHAYQVKYDLLVGADGAGSKVRDVLVSALEGFTVDVNDSGREYKVRVLDMSRDHLGQTADDLYVSDLGRECHVRPLDVMCNCSSQVMVTVGGLTG